MSDYAERDEQVAEMIRREIAKVKAEAESYGWKQPSAAWYKAFGEIAGLHRALALIDPAPHS